MDVEQPTVGGDNAEMDVTQATETPALKPQKSFEGKSVYYCDQHPDDRHYGYCAKDSGTESVTIYNFNGTIGDTEREWVSLREYPQSVWDTVPKQCKSVGVCRMEEFEQQLPIVNRTQHDVLVLCEQNPEPLGATATPEDATAHPQWQYRVFPGTLSSGLKPVEAKETAPKCVTMAAECGVVIVGPTSYGDPVGLEDVDWEDPSTHVDLILSIIGAQAVCAYLKRNHITYHGVIYTPGTLVRNERGVIMGCLNLRAYHSPEYPLGGQ